MTLCQDGDIRKQLEDASKYEHLSGSANAHLKYLVDNSLKSNEKEDFTGKTAEELAKEYRNKKISSFLSSIQTALRNRSVSISKKEAPLLTSAQGILHFQKLLRSLYVLKTEDYLQEKEGVLNKKSFDLLVHVASLAHKLFVTGKVEDVKAAESVVKEYKDVDSLIPDGSKFILRLRTSYRLLCAMNQVPTLIKKSGNIKLNEGFKASHKNFIENLNKHMTALQRALGLEENEHVKSIFDVIKDLKEYSLDEKTLHLHFIALSSINTRLKSLKKDKKIANLKEKAAKKFQSIQTACESRYEKLEFLQKKEELKADVHTFIEKELKGLLNVSEDYDLLKIFPIKVADPDNDPNIKDLKVNCSDERKSGQWIHDLQNAICEYQCSQLYKK